nr:MAG TPA: hypothetical protein [Caudoviricetes sp.]
MNKNTNLVLKLNRKNATMKARKMSSKGYIYLSLNCGVRNNRYRENMLLCSYGRPKRGSAKNTL